MNNNRQAPTLALLAALAFGWVTGPVVAQSPPEGSDAGSGIQPENLLPEDLEASVFTERGLPARTVFVDRTGDRQEDLAAAATQMHEEMAAKGWTFLDLSVYTEDGDMQGLFLTYLKYEETSKVKE